MRAAAIRTQRDALAADVEHAVPSAVHRQHLCSRRCRIRSERCHPQVTSRRRSLRMPLALTRPKALPLERARRSRGKLGEPRPTCAKSLPSRRCVVERIQYWPADRDAGWHCPGCCPASHSGRRCMLPTRCRHAGAAIAWPAWAAAAVTPGKSDDPAAGRHRPQRPALSASRIRGQSVLITRFASKNWLMPKPPCPVGGELSTPFHHVSLP